MCCVFPSHLLCSPHPSTVNSLIRRQIDHHLLTLGRGHFSVVSIPIHRHLVALSVPIQHQQLCLGGQCVSVQQLSTGTVLHQHCLGDCSGRCRLHHSIALRNRLRLRALRRHCSGCWCRLCGGGSGPAHCRQTLRSYWASRGRRHGTGTRWSWSNCGFLGCSCARCRWRWTGRG